ncbi:hypothetical protein MVEN_00119400 [Mycena venus]|uniref:Uncharacterized protein n=1 Tax=Mycena venus TaxID=2733690 RepID=A0A8H7DHM6_9AGAR|nr:hypothetical protein MVEN_00119400 [Mycena venus]
MVIRRASLRDRAQHTALRAQETEVIGVGLVEIGNPEELGSWGCAIMVVTLIKQERTADQYPPGCLSLRPISPHWVAIRLILHQHPSYEPNPELRRARRYDNLTSYLGWLYVVLYLEGGRVREIGVLGMRAPELNRHVSLRMAMLTGRRRAAISHHTGTLVATPLLPNRAVPVHDTSPSMQISSRTPPNASSARTMPNDAAPSFCRTWLYTPFVFGAPPPPHPTLLTPVPFVFLIVRCPLADVHPLCRSTHAHSAPSTQAPSRRARCTWPVLLSTPGPGSTAPVDGEGVYGNTREPERRDRGRSWPRRRWNLAMQRRTMRGARERACPVMEPVVSTLVETVPPAMLRRCADEMMDINIDIGGGDVLRVYASSSASLHTPRTPPRLASAPALAAHA